MVGTPAGAEPGTRDWIGGLVAVAGTLALGGVVLAAMVGPALACACAAPPALVVTNRSSEAVTVEWTGQGWFGSRHSMVVAACEVATPAEFEPRRTYDVAAGGAEARWTGTLVAPTAADSTPGLQLAVMPGGRIERVWGEVPRAGSSCPPDPDG